MWRWKKQYTCSKKNMNNNLVFFRDKIKIFIISLFETRSRICSIKSRISRRGREIKKGFLVVEREFSLLLFKISGDFSRSRNLVMLWDQATIPRCVTAASSFVLQHHLISKIMAKDQDEDQRPTLDLSFE